MVTKLGLEHNREAFIRIVKFLGIVMFVGIVLGLIVEFFIGSGWPFIIGDVSPPSTPAGGEGLTNSPEPSLFSTIKSSFLYQLIEQACNWVTSLLIAIGSILLHLFDSEGPTDDSFGEDEEENDAPAIGTNQPEQRAIGNHQAEQAIGNQQPEQAITNQQPAPPLEHSDRIQVLKTYAEDGRERRAATAAYVEAIREAFYDTLPPEPMPSEVPTGAYEGMFRILQERWEALYGADPAEVREQVVRRLREAATREAVEARPGVRWENRDRPGLFALLDEPEWRPDKEIEIEIPGSSTAIQPRGGSRVE